MITFQPHENRAANDMKKEQQRWSHSNDMKAITPKDMEMMRFQRHEKDTFWAGAHKYKKDLGERCFVINSLWN